VSNMSRMQALATVSPTLAKTQNSPKEWQDPFQPGTVVAQVRLKTVGPLLKVDEMHWLQMQRLGVRKMQTMVVCSTKHHKRPHRPPHRPRTAPFQGRVEQGWCLRLHAVGESQSEVAAA